MSRFDPYPFPGVTLDDVASLIDDATEGNPKLRDYAHAALRADVEPMTKFPGSGSTGGTSNYDQPYRQYVRAVLFGRDDNVKAALRSIDWIKAWIHGHDLVVTTDNQHRFLEGLVMVYQAARKRSQFSELADLCASVFYAHHGHVLWALRANTGQFKQYAPQHNQRIMSRLIGSGSALLDTELFSDKAPFQIALNNAVQQMWHIQTYNPRERHYERHGWGIDPGGHVFCGDELKTHRYGNPKGTCRYIPYQMFQFQPSAMRAYGESDGMVETRFRQLQKWFRDFAYVDHDDDMQRGTGPTRPVDVLDAGGNVAAPNALRKWKLGGGYHDHMNQTGEMLYPYYHFFEAHEREDVARALRATIAQCKAHWPEEMTRCLFAPELVNWIYRHKAD